MDDNTLKTKFTAWFWDRRKMRQEGNQIARDMGMDGGDIDSFRHAYVSAKMADRWRQVFGSSFEGGVRLMGLANEIGGFSNSFEDHLADLGNNEWGLAFRSEVDREIAELLKKGVLKPENLEEYRERLLRTKIAIAIRERRLTQNPLGKPRKSYASKSDEVLVHSYSRQGQSVKSHTRSKPDGIRSNNKSR